MVKYVESEIAEIKRNPFDIKERMVYTSDGSGKKVVLNKCLDKDIEVAIIPEGVEHIGMCAFQYCTKLKKISLPRSVSWIESSAFEGCTALKEVEILSSSVILEQFCFIGCTALETLPFRDNTLKYGVPWGAFRQCKGLVNITIPDGVRSIGDFAFEGCTSLREVIIPDSVKRIQHGAFSGCLSLEHVVLPDGIEDIEAQAFKGCGDVAIDYRGVQLSVSDFANGITEELALMVQDTKDNAAGRQSDTDIANAFDFGF